MYFRPDDVAKAIEVSQGKKFFGSQIEVSATDSIDAEDNTYPLEAELDEYHPKATRTLFIGNLHTDVTPSEIKKEFEVFGEILVRLCKRLCLLCCASNLLLSRLQEIDVKAQASPAFAFVQYSDITSVVKAMRRMDGEQMGSSRIKVSLEMQREHFSMFKNDFIRVFLIVGLWQKHGHKLSLDGWHCGICD